jgi:UTP--glucose-1-phosphate uridylyltransferase
MMKPVRKAVFPVGGLGTRFLPATKAMPKEMLPVVDKPLIQWAVEEAQAAGIEEFIFVTARGKTSLEDHFDHSFELTQMLSEKGKEVELSAITDILEEPGQVVYTRQQKPLGLGHAVWCARNLVGDEPFAVLLADDLVLADKPCLAQMIETHAKVGGNMVAVMEIPREHTDRYGILDIEKEEGRLVSVRGLIEKPDPSSAPSTLAIIGRYVLAPEIFTYLVSQEPGAGGEIQLTDALAAMIGVAPFHGLKFQGQRFDCGDKCGYLEANIALALEREELREEVRKICRAYS